MQINTRSNEVREKLIKENLCLVKAIAERINRAVHDEELTLEDMMGYGMIGLIEAVDKYDDQKGDLKAFLSCRIKGSIYDQLRAGDPLKRTSRQKIKRLNKCVAELQNSLNKQPSDEEIAAHLNISQVELKKLQVVNAISTVSLDEPFDSDSNETLLNQISDLKTPIEELCEKKEMLEILRKTVKKLPEREGVIIEMHHFRKISLKEIAQMLGVSESRISQIHNKALSALRVLLEAHVL